MSKVLAFIKKPAVSHAIAVGLTVAAGYFATGKVDFSPLLGLVGIQ
jgi:hypothetical protein